MAQKSLHVIGLNGLRFMAHCWVVGFHCLATMRTLGRLVRNGDSGIFDVISGLSTELLLHKHYTRLRGGSAAIPVSYAKFAHSVPEQPSRGDCSRRTSESASESAVPLNSASIDAGAGTAQIRLKIGTLNGASTGRGASAALPSERRKAQIDAANFTFHETIEGYIGWVKRRVLLPAIIAWIISLLSWLIFPIPNASGRRWLPAVLTFTLPYHESFFRNRIVWNPNPVVWFIHQTIMFWMAHPWLKLVFKEFFGKSRFSIWASFLIISVANFGLCVYLGPIAAHFSGWSFHPLPRLFQYFGGMWLGHLVILSRTQGLDILNLPTMKCFGQVIGGTGDCEHVKPHHDSEVVDQSGAVAKTSTEMVGRSCEQSWLGSESTVLCNPRTAEYRPYADGLGLNSSEDQCRHSICLQRILRVLKIYSPDLVFIVYMLIENGGPKRYSAAWNTQWMWRTIGITPLLILIQFCFILQDPGRQQWKPVPLKRSLEQETPDKAFEVLGHDAEMGSTDDERVETARILGVPRQDAKTYGWRQLGAELCRLFFSTSPLMRMFENTYITKIASSDISYLGFLFHFPLLWYFGKAQTNAGKHSCQFLLTLYFIICNTTTHILPKLVSVVTFTQALSLRSLRKRLGL